MGIDLEAFENEVVTQIQTAVDAGIADVIAMPEDDGDYNRPDQKGKIIVAFDNSDFKEPLDTLGMSQEEWLEFIVTIQSRTLRSTNGIYTLFKLIKDALIGYTPANCTIPISGKWFGPPELGTKPRYDEVWTFEFHMRTKSVLVQALDVPMDGGVLPTIGNVDLTENAELILPDPLPLQGLDDPAAPIISLSE